MLSLKSSRPFDWTSPAIYGFVHSLSEGSFFCIFMNHPYLHVGSLLNHSHLMILLTPDLSLIARKLVELFSNRLTSQCFTNSLSLLFAHQDIHETLASHTRNSSIKIVLGQNTPMPWRRTTSAKAEAYWMCYSSKRAKLERTISTNAWKWDISSSKFCTKQWSGIHHKAIIQHRIFQNFFLHRSRLSQN